MAIDREHESAEINSHCGQESPSEPLGEPIARLENGLRNREKLKQFEKVASPVGRLRHVIALLALSGILLANMNRQAYNQGLVRMIRRRPQPVELAPEVLDAEEGLILPSEPAFGLDAGGLEPAAAAAGRLAGASLEEESNRANGTSGKDEQLVMEPAGEDKFDWSGAQVSLLQAAFFHGYMPFMIPGGRLAEVYGAKWVIFFSGFGSALCSLLTPLLADHSFGLLVASRILMGVCQTGISPALFALLTRWLPPDESSVYLAMIKAGVMFGFMFGSLINGFLSWRLTFYFVGVIGLLWSLMWALCVSSNPEEHKFLGANELSYIKRRLREFANESAKQNEANEQEEEAPRGRLSNKSAPWWNIVTNPVVIAFTLTKFTIKFSTDTQSMQIPMYLKSVFQVSDQLNGILNGINFAIQGLLTGVVAYLAREMIARKAFGLNKTQVRKVFQGLNNFGMASAYLMISFNFGSLSVVCFAVILLSVSSMFGSGGESVLPVDITTEYSASIMAIANSVANLSGILLPAIVSLILSNELQSQARWNLVWWTIGAVMASGGLVFIVFVEARVQDFASNKLARRSGGGIAKGRGCDNVSFEEETAKQVELRKINKFTET